MRGASVASNNMDGDIRLWPFSDGVPPLPYPDASDADAISRALCSRLCDGDSLRNESCPGAGGDCSGMAPGWIPAPDEEVECPESP